MSAQHTAKSAGLPSHHPVRREYDSLNAKIYAETVCQLIINANEHNTGMTLGIYGGWGAGKSSILKMIRENLESKPNHERFLVVEFDPWRYKEREEIWLGMIRKILQTIEIERSTSLWRINYALWEKRLDSNPVFWQNLGTIILTGIVAGLVIFLAVIPLLNTESIWVRLAIALSGGLVAFIVNLLGATGKSLVAILSGKVDLKLPPLGRPAFDRAASISVDDFREDFKAIIKSVGTRKTITVLIDDLDRCAPDQVVPLLEAIKHFGFDEPLNRECPTIVFVLAADQSTIATCVQAQYKDFLPAEPTQVERFIHEYMEKIVQYNFFLHPPSRAQISELLFSTLSRRNIDGLDEHQFAIDIDVSNQIIPIVAQGVVHQPRSALQAFRNFSSNWLISRQLGLELNPKLLGLFSLMQDFWPREFEFLFQCPEYFFYLHNMVCEESNLVFAQSEALELHDLGLPKGAKNPLLDAYSDKDLGRLISELSNEIRDLEIDKLSEYVFFRPHLALSNTRSISLRESAMSGDPVYLHYASRTNPIGASYISFLLADLKQASDSVHHSTPVVQQDIDSAETLIFAIGRAPSTDGETQRECFAALQDMLGEELSLPRSLQLRSIYAIGHLASQGSNDALDFLKNVANGTKYARSIQRRSELLLGTFSLPSSVAAEIVPSIYKRVKFSTQTILTALETIELEKIQFDVIVDLSELVSVDFVLPDRIGYHLVTILRDANEDPLHTRAFDLVTAHTNPEQAMVWLFELSKSAQVWMHQCYQELGSLQAICRWDAEIWDSIIADLGQRKWPEESVMIVIESLERAANKYKNEVRAIFQLLLNTPPTGTRWKNHLSILLADKFAD